MAATSTAKSSFLQKFINGLFSFFTRAKPIISKIEEAAPVVEEILGMAFPEVDGAIEIANSLFGHVLAVASDAEGAITAGGLNVNIDGQLLEDILAILPKVVNAAVKTNAGAVAAGLSTSLSPTPRVNTGAAIPNVG